MTLFVVPLFILIKMKILYYAEVEIPLVDFGILIPIADDRSKKCFDLLKNKFLNLSELQLLDLPEIVEEDILRVHNKGVVERFYSDRGLEKELCQVFELFNSDGTVNVSRFNLKGAKKPLFKMRESIIFEIQGTFMAMQEALKYGESFFLGGGMHHAMSFGGRGFCPLHDIMIGLKKLQIQNKIKTAWVVDVDAHKGDGTAELTQKDNSVSTLSIHMERGWPLDIGVKTDENGHIYPWYIPSTIDIPIGIGEEKEYLPKLEKGLYDLEKKMEFTDLVLIVGGADPYEKDELPSAQLLKLSKLQLLQRDMLLYNFFKKRKIPQVWVMAGGYGIHSYEIYVQFLEKVLAVDS